MKKLFSAALPPLLYTRAIFYLSFYTGLSFARAAVPYAILERISGFEQPSETTAP